MTDAGSAAARRRARRDFVHGLAGLVALCWHGVAHATDFPAANGTWETFFSPGVDDEATAIAVSGTSVYVAGKFQSAGDVRAERIAEWSSQTRRWTALSRSLVDEAGNGAEPSVTSLAVLDGQLYAAGRFTRIDGRAVSNIARRDANGWHPVGEVGPGVTRLRAMGGKLYAFGYFGAPPYVGYAQRWNGHRWENLEKLGAREALVDGSNIYFVDSSVHRWDGNHMQSLGFAIWGGSAPQTLAVFQGQLYAGGSFVGVGPEGAAYVARWDGSGWHKVGQGIDLAVSRLAATDDALYALAGEYPSHIMRWDGSQWSGLGETSTCHPDSGVLRELVRAGDSVAVAGRLSEIGGDAAHNAALLDVAGGRWIDVADERGTGVDGPVGGIAELDGDLLVVGDFCYAGDTRAPFAARWDGNQWHSVGDGAAGELGEVVSGAPGVFASGVFGTGDALYTGIGRYDDDKWTITEMKGVVSDLLMADENLYAAGVLYNPDSIELAQWNGQSWSSLVVGGDADSIQSLAWWNSSLHVAGGFSAIGSSNVPLLARRDGTKWKSLGSGIPDEGGNAVRYLAATEDALYVSGDFDEAGGNPAAGLASWNGSSWSSLDAGQTAAAGPAISAADDTLYAYAKPELLRRQAQTWERVGARFSGTRVEARFAASDVWAFGTFTAIGQRPSLHLARWNGCDASEACATTTSSTTTTEEMILCGDANDDGAVTASDAAAALRTAVGPPFCDIDICDMDGSGTVTAGDALSVLRMAVGQGVDAHCPAAG